MSKGHNSAKNHQTGTRLAYAQLGMILINPTKFNGYPTKGYGETAWTNFQWKYFKVL